MQLVGKYLSSNTEVFLGRNDEALVSLFYRQMFFIRRFEERLLELFDEGVLNGTTHCCIGQEANCVAVTRHLEAGDHIFSNHRCHGHYLARTGDALGLFAEIMGKEGGICGGIGGSQHICAAGFKSNGILGGTIPTAAGIALAKKLRGENEISVVFMGDGAFGEGVVYEALNISSLWNLPLLIVVENNQWSQSTPISMNLAGSITDRFKAFGISVEEVTSTDVQEIDVIAEQSIQKVRSEGRPSALVIDTYRLCHHSKNDDARPAEEVEARRSIEPLRVHALRLEENERQSIEEEVNDRMEVVIEEARALR